MGGAALGSAVPRRKPTSDSPKALGSWLMARSPWGEGGDCSLRATLRGGMAERSGPAGRRAEAVQPLEPTNQSNKNSNHDTRWIFFSVAFHMRTTVKKDQKKIRINKNLSRFDLLHPSY